MNNSLLAIITQEFRWLLFIRSYTRTLKQIHKFVQGVWFVFTLFNLQGTVVKATGFNLFILPHLFLFVKNFFPKSRFFEPHLETFPPEPAGCLDLAGIWQGKSPNLPVKACVRVTYLPGQLPAKYCQRT